jgi:hypothetical protein
MGKMARLLSPDIIMYALIILAFGIGTYERNRVWGSGVSLLKDTVSKSPNKERPHTNLGYELIMEERFEEAIVEDLKSIEIGGKDYIPYQHLGIAYFSIGDLNSAYYYAHQAATMERTEATLIPLGMILKEKGYKTDGKRLIKP